jgi:adenylate cyclase
MTTAEIKRKLTAILSADAKGYSRLMGEDEKGTVRTLNTYREVMANLIQRHHGRVVDAPGDNLLAEFGSVVDAVECAVEIQKELKTRNAELADNRRMEFRIGVNLGDVIEEEGRIYGDGVNIAARLESLSDAGGICISGTAFDHVENKLSLGYEYFGEQTVKNIAKPVRVYRVLMEPEAAGKVIGERKAAPRGLPKPALALRIAVVVVATAVAVGFVIWHLYLRPAPRQDVASVEKMAFPLPDKPSIAVLPFVNMSGDAKQEFLGDGITENIISALSQVPTLFVIARQSTFTYKGKPVKIQQVGEDLGVRYVLEGSVQRSGDTLRVTAQLIDATTGHHVWSERYDREMKGIFALQDDITMKIISAFQVKLMEGEHARLLAKGTENLQAYLKFLQAREIFFTVTREGNAQARRLMEEAIAMDPQFSSAYVTLGWITYMDVPLGLSKSPYESYRQAFELAKKAVAMDESFSGAHTLLGFIHVLMGRQYDKGIAECERAIALAPNSAAAHSWMGQVLMLAGRHEEAVRHSEQALRLDPIPPGWYYRILGLAYFHAGRYEEAIAAHKKSLNRAPNDILSRLALTTAYSWAGRLEEARAQAAEVLRINPKFCVEERAKMGLYKNQADLERYLEGLRKAGLPEKPSASIRPSAEVAPKEKVVPPLREKVSKQVTPQVTPPSRKEEVASKEKMVFPLPDVPSIAVMPFVNMSEDPKQEFLSDGITENIITALSKLPRLFVISRQSTSFYKGKPVKVKQVSEELGVRYVMEGSVQRSGDRIRINAQLIDALTGRHIWAERYDRELKDIFVLQDEITVKIVRAMRVKLTEGEQFLAEGKSGKPRLDCSMKISEGFKYFEGFNIEATRAAQRIAEETIAICPDYPVAYVLMGFVHQMEFLLRIGRSPQESIEKGIEMAQKALAIDDSTPMAHSLLCSLYLYKREHDKAIAEGERAVALDPSGAFAHEWYATSLNLSGRSEESVPMFQKAIRLNPVGNTGLYTSFGNALRMTGRFEEAISAYKKALQRAPNNILAHIGLTATYSLMDREKEARAEAEEVLRLNPKFSLEGFAKMLPSKNQAQTDRYIDALRKAGLK